VEDWNEIAQRMDAAKELEAKASQQRGMEIQAREQAIRDERSRQLESLLVPARHFLRLMAMAGNPGATVDHAGLEESICDGWTTEERIRVSDRNRSLPKVEDVYVRIGVRHPHLWQCPLRTDKRWLWYSLRDPDLEAISPEWLTQQCIRILRKHEVSIS
jgi:hypothetical protein